MRHLVSIADLTRDDVERILETAGALQGVDEKLPTQARPSTRASRSRTRC